MRLSELIEKIEKIWSPKWATENDYVGLICGNTASQIRKILLALDGSENVLNEAGKGEYNLLFIHHPLKTGGLFPAVAGKEAGGKIFNAITWKIAIYCAHSNLDAAPNGTSTILAEMLGIDFKQFLVPVAEEKLVKLVIFVPRENAEDFRAKLLDSGVGWIGNYSHCSFSIEGEGTFMPHEGTSPYIGKAGKFEKVKEIRLETILPISLLTRTLELIKKHHPYEEPAFDIYQVEQKGKQIAGYGVCGEFKQPVTLEELAEICKTKLPAGFIIVCGERERKLKRAVVLSGNGGNLVDKVKENNADVFITGEIDHKSALELMENGISVIAVGHFASEWVVLPYVRGIIKEIFEGRNEDVIINIAESEHSPFWILK